MKNERRLLKLTYFVESEVRIKIANASGWKEILEDVSD